MNNQLRYVGSLHNHTDFSQSNFRLRDSINTVEGLINYAIELGHEVVAITEHETISSAIRAQEYYEKIKKENPNFKVILGNEIYLTRNGLNAQNYNREFDRYFHFILLAKNKEGHKQIREISSRAWMRSYVARGMRRVPTYYQDLIDIIGKNPGNVIASTGCLGGALAVQLLRYKDSNDEELLKKIKKWCMGMVEVFGEGNFYLEMQPSATKDQKYVNQMIIKLSEELNIPFIITNDAHYLKKEDRQIHKAFLNSQNGDREVDSFYATTYLMGDEEIRSFMKEDLGEENLQKAYQNILEIKNKCEDYSLKKNLKIPELNWKEYDISNDEMDYWDNKISNFHQFRNSEYKEDRLLVEAIVDRIRNDKELQDEQTLNEIGGCLKDTWVSSEVNGSRWSAYFLNLQKIIDCCWDAGSLVGAGRGSGVGFILLYILGITQINPLKEKSPTRRWRFLNPKRVSVLD